MSFDKKIMETKYFQIFSFDTHTFIYLNKFVWHLSVFLKQSYYLFESSISVESFACCHIVNIGAKKPEGVGC